MNGGQWLTLPNPRLTATGLTPHARKHRFHVLPFQFQKLTSAWPFGLISGHPDVNATMEVNPLLYPEHYCIQNTI